MSKIFTSKKSVLQLLVLTLLINFFSCKPEEEPIPTGASLGAELNEEKMIDILTDLHLAEGFAQIRPKKEKDSILSLIHI